MSFLQSQKICCMSKIKGDRIFIQSLHQVMGINFEVRSHQKKLFKACYKCGKSGHFKRDCWVKVACHHCGKSGHIKLNCRNQKLQSLKNPNSRCLSSQLLRKIVFKNCTNFLKIAIEHMSPTMIMLRFSRN